MNSNDRNKRQRPAAGRPRPVNQRRPEGAGQPSPRKPARGQDGSNGATRESQNGSGTPSDMSVWEIARLEEKQRLEAQRERARRQAAEVRRLQALAQADDRSARSSRQGKATAGRSAQARAAQARAVQARGTKAGNVAARGRRPQPNAKSRPRSKASSKSMPQGLQGRLSRFALTSWMVPKRPLAELNSFERTAWKLLYAGIVVVLLAGLVYSIVKSTEVKKTPAETDSVRSTTEVPVSIYKCKLSDLEMSVKLPATQISIGSPVQFGLTITNRGDFPCTLDASPHNLGIYIMSGQETIFNPGVCGEKAEQALLIDAKTTVEHKITWDSKLRNEKCEAGENAAAGTYVATPYVERKLDNPDAPFVIK